MSLRWWSSALRIRRDTRALHGIEGIEPIEIALPPSSPERTPSTVEVAIGETIIRCQGGVDVEYIAALVRAMNRR
jgi:hypothetical protein